MGMLRADAVKYLAGRYGPLEEETDTAPLDKDIGYKQVITDALITLPTDYDDALDPAYEVNTKLRAYRALLRFYALTLFKGKLATDESFTAGDSINEKRSIYFAQVNMMLDDVVEELFSLGYTVGTTGTMPKRGLKLHDLYGDMIEPIFKDDLI